jgi:hypothetical protein
MRACRFETHLFAPAEAPLPRNDETVPTHRSLSAQFLVKEPSMATSILEARGGCIVPKAETRGYHIVYREQDTNYCPGCGRTHWYIGRSMAECAFCATALPLENAPMIAGGQTVRTIRRPMIPEQACAA